MNEAYKIIENLEAFNEFKSLLKSSSLPSDDLDYKRDFLVGYYEDGTLVGTGGLEVYGNYALLRSLSVKLGIRGKSVGTTMTDFLLEKARSANIKAVYLLTETARGFFLRKQFADIDRGDVPDEVKRSSEFRTVCPASAIAMVRYL